MNIFRNALYKPNSKKIYWEKIISSVVVLSGLLLYINHDNKRINRKTRLRNEFPKYTIGITVGGQNIIRGNPAVDYVYYVEGREYKSWNTYARGYYDVKKVGLRYFVKYSSKDPSNAVILFQCPVPENVKSAPFQGWDQLPVDCNE